MRLSTQARDAASDAIAPLFNDGYLRFYTGAMPATPNTAVTGTLLATLRFENPAFSSSVNGVITFGNLTEDSSVDADGTPGYARALQSDGTTPIADFSVAAAAADINFNTVGWTTGLIADVVSGGLLTIPM